MERPGSPSATTVAPASKRRSTSMEIRRSRLGPGRPPKKGVSSRNAFRSGELTAIELIYAGGRPRQAALVRCDASGTGQRGIVSDSDIGSALETGYTRLDHVAFSGSTSNAASMEGTLK